jgi:hypothetical protein
MKHGEGKGMRWILLTGFLIAGASLFFPLYSNSATSLLPLQEIGTNSATSSSEKKVGAAPEDDVFREALEEYRRQIDRVMQNARNTAGKTTVRSPQSQFHGNFYDYLRNDLLDALPHEVRQAGGVKSLLRRNQFGFNLTGPVVIPRLWDGGNRTFFSITYEGTRERLSRSFVSTVSTIPERTGDFSDLVDDAGLPVIIYDPLTTRPNPAYDPLRPVSTSNLQYLRDPFPGNVIPLDRIDPISQKLISYYPSPNTNIGPFLRNNYFINGAETNTPNGLIWKLDHSIGTHHKLALSGNYSNGLTGAPLLIDNPANPGQPNRQVLSRSLNISETFNLSPTLVNQFTFSTSYNAQASEFEGSDVNYPELLGLQGVQPGVFPRFEIFHNYLDLGMPGWSYSRQQSAYYSFSDYLTFRHQKHNFRFSFSAVRAQVNSYRPTTPSGMFDFHGALTSLPGINNTGNSFAQFLLGWADEAQQSIVLNPSYFRNQRYRLGWGDDYQLTANFHLNFNLGIFINTPRREKYDRQSTVDLNLINPANQRPGALAFAGTGGRSQSFSPAQVRLEPSIGWSLNPWGDRKTVIRGGYSIWQNSFPIYSTSFGTLGFNAQPLLVSPNDQLTPVLHLAEGFPSSFIPPPDLRPEAANGIRADYFDPKGQLPYGQDWSLEIERDLAWNFILHASYSGSKGTHLFNGDGIELNPLPVSALSYRDKLNDLNFNLSLRPYPQYTSLTAGYAYPVGSSISQEGTLRLEKRMTHGLNFNFSYAFGKSIDDMLYGNPPQNSTLLQSEKSLSCWDVTHRINWTGLYELPWGAGKPLLNQAGWTDKILGRLTLSGTASFRSGTPLILVPLFNNTGGVAEGLRVNAVSGIDPHVDSPSPVQWFNAAAFTQPPDFSLGNVSRTHPNLRNPGAQNIDLSLTKRIPLQGDWSMELLMEAFNAFNHANWNNPDTTIGSADNPNLNAGKIIGSTGGRIIQLGIRVNF